MSQHALIIGFGFIGRRLARKLSADGWHVSALVRSPSASEAAASLPVAPLSGDLDQSDSLAKLAGTTFDAVFHLAPPPQDGTADPRIDHLLAALTQPPAALIYISTTGVYGDHRGGMVTEDCPVNPQTDRAKRRLYAENALIRYAEAHPTVRHVILRVSGIYGPGKLPLARLQRQEPIVEDANRPSFVNVVHADDLVTICIAAAAKAPRGAVYNVSGKEPVTMAAYMDIVADAAKLPRPPRISWEQAKSQISPGMLSYLNESRRVSSAKVQRELGIELRYGNVKEGVAAALREPEK